jgi:hypothetical protein
MNVNTESTVFSVITYVLIYETVQLLVPVRYKNRNSHIVFTQVFYTNDDVNVDSSKMFSIY